MTEPALPRLLASSVVRGTRLGQSHGGLFLVDMRKGTCQRKLDWNSTDIDIAGRGGDRGLRGIAFYADHIIVAANAEILFLDREFAWTQTYTCRYLRHCHELAVRDDLLFVTSTGFDSVLTFDLISRRFINGVQLSYRNGVPTADRYDPQGVNGPAPSQSLHINSVTATADELVVGGVRMQELLGVSDATVRRISALPLGTHNAQLLDDGVIYNDTAADRICYQRHGQPVYLSVPHYAEATIQNPDRLDSTVARPHFARGLCKVADGYVAAGSSPSTLSVYDLAKGERVLSRNLSMDVRNAIHGLAAWPWD